MSLLFSVPDRQYLERYHSSTIFRCALCEILICFITSLLLHILTWNLTFCQNRNLTYSVANLLIFPELFRGPISDSNFATDTPSVLFRSPENDEASTSDLWHSCWRHRKGTQETLEQFFCRLIFLKKICCLEENVCRSIRLRTPWFFNVFFFFSSFPFVAVLKGCAATPCRLLRVRQQLAQSVRRSGLWAVLLLFFHLLLSFSYEPFQDSRFSSCFFGISVDQLTITERSGLKTIESGGSLRIRNVSMMARTLWHEISKKKKKKVSRKSTESWNNERSKFEREGSETAPTSSFFDAASSASIQLLERNQTNEHLQNRSA
jgi:hypothetical protein